MPVLVDTSVLGRLANTDDPSHTVAGAAVLEMRRQHETLLTAAQNLIRVPQFRHASSGGQRSGVDRLGSRSQVAGI